MALVTPNGGEVDHVELIVGKRAEENLSLRLYVNDKVPADTDVAADYTEMSTLGYAAKTLTGASWTVTPGDPAVGVYAAQTFEFDAGTPVAVYGYFVLGAVSGRLRWAERFPAGQVVGGSAVDFIAVTPQYTGRDEAEV
jgi:hypothetical protein